MGTDITPAHRSTAGAVPIGNPQGQGQPLAWTAPPAASPCAALIAVDNCTDVDHNFPALSPHLGKRVQSPNETPGDKQQAGLGSEPSPRESCSWAAHTADRWTRGKKWERGWRPRFVYLGTQRKAHSNSFQKWVAQTALIPLTLIRG